MPLRSNLGRTAITHNSPVPRSAKQNPTTESWNWHSQPLKDEDNFSIIEEAGLYIVADGMGGHASGEVASQMAMLWVLNQSDGTHSLLDIAERSKLPFAPVRQAARALEGAGLLRVKDPTEGRTA